MSQASNVVLGIAMVLVTPFLFADGPSVEAKPFSSSINLDGKLDEPAWRAAPVLRLVQQSSTAQQISLHSGKILRIAKQKEERQSVCCYTPTDAPLQSDVIDYDISVQVEHTIYVVRYQTWTGYVPWTEDDIIDVKIDKHLVYLKTRSGEEMRLPLLRYQISENQPP